MFFAIAALLIQPAVPAQMFFSADKAALVEPAAIVSSSAAAADETVAPAIESASAELPSAPEPSPIISTPVTSPVRQGKSDVISVGELRAEYRRNQWLWRGLGVAAHSTAMFDAWTTRRAITTQGAHELNPFLKPFAGNSSIYAAIQVAPFVADYAAKKMMYSRHGWERRMWWVPQSVSFASSLFGGVHNLGVGPASK